MAQPSARIHIARPCHENWADMPADELGRRCAACQESVVDFTRMSDGQIVTFLGQHAHISCGRFTADQLNRTLVGLAPPPPRWRRWLTAVAAVLGVGAAATPAARAQATYELPGGMPHPATAPDTATARAAALPAPADSVVIYGTVHNRLGLPLKAWVRVQVGQTEHRVRANALGYFTLTVATAHPADAPPPRRPALRCRAITISGKARKWS